MNYIFYDTEGTGTHRRYDVPLQYAAIRTDGNLNTIEEIDIRSRLPKHITPHPQALFVTHVDPYGLTNDPTAMSPYAFASAINEFQAARNDTIFVGQNILGYDEEIMRTMMFMNMQDPYVSSRRGNQRIDTLPMLQLMHALDPGFIKTTLNDNGNTIFKLDKIAPLNGFSEHNAHDALGDDRATIFMFNLVRNLRPALFDMAVELSKPESVDRTLSEARQRGEPVYMMLHYGKPEWKCVYPIAKFQKKWGCIDIAQDTRFWEECNSSQWYDRAYPYLSKQQGTLPGIEAIGPSDEQKMASRQFQSVAINKQPPIVTRSMLERVGVDPERLGIVDMPGADTLAMRTRALGRTSVALSAQSAMERQSKAFAPSPNIEEKLYAGFPKYSDKSLMESFRSAKNWEVRRNIIGSFEMDNLRQVGIRIMFEEAPTLLSTAPQLEQAIIQRRMYATPGAGNDDNSIPWTTMPAAMIAANTLHAEHNNEETARILRWFTERDAMLRAKMSTYTTAPATATATATLPTRKNDMER